jgi:arylsulfatase A-like enzyme
MNRCTPWLLLAFALGLLASCQSHSSSPTSPAADASGSAQASEAQRPNVIVFLVDDMGWQDTSVPFHTETTELNRIYRTPNMERLAEEGVMFTQAYACAVCSPSRVSLMTGMNAARHGVTNWTLHFNQSPDPKRKNITPPDWPMNGIAPRPGTERTVTATCLPQILSDAGYQTIHVGKAHFGSIDSPGEDPLNLGFDVNIAGHAPGGPGSHWGEKNFSAAWRNGARFWDVPGLDQYHGQDIYLTEALTLEAIKELDQCAAQQQPFFLYMSHYAIHAPWEADNRYTANYADAGLSEFQAKYATMIEGMDKSLGDLLHWLDQNNLADDTLVLFMTDNGQPKQAPRNLPLRGSKLTPYEGGTRVPMIARWPGQIGQGGQQSMPVMIEDFLPTILAATQTQTPADLPQTVDGLNFLPLMQNGSSWLEEPANANHPLMKFANRDLIWHFPHTYDGPPYSAIRRGDWKLVYWYVDERVELFNLVDDLGESTNLADTESVKASELLTALHNQLNARGALLPTIHRSEKGKK